MTAGSWPLNHKLEKGQILEGDLFSEPMRIVEIETQDPDVSTLGLVGLVTERFRSVRLTREQLERLSVRSTLPSYTGDGIRLRLGIQAYTLGIAYEFEDLARIQELEETLLRPVHVSREEYLRSCHFYAPPH